MPEIASGDFEEVVSTLFDRKLGRLVRELPPSLTQRQRADLMSDFSRGRAHFAFFHISLKTHAMHQAPRLLFATAHYDIRKSKAALEVLAISHDDS